MNVNLLCRWWQWWWHIAAFQNWWVLTQKYSHIAVLIGFSFVCWFPFSKKKKKVYFNIFVELMLGIVCAFSSSKNLIIYLLDMKKRGLAFRFFGEYIWVVSLLWAWKILAVQLWTASFCCCCFLRLPDILFSSRPVHRSQIRCLAEQVLVQVRC